MDSVMNYHFFENEIRLISCAYYPRLLWEERHPPKSYWCFFWNAEEDKSIRFSGEDLPFGGEHGVLIPPYAAYQVSSDGREIPLLYLYFELKPAYETVISRRKSVFLNRAERAELLELCAMILSGNAVPWRSALPLRIAANVLLKLGPADFSAPEQPDKRIREALEIINRDYAEHLDNRKICRRINMSQNNFLRLFQRDVGQTPHSYLNYIRIRNARRLLREGGASIDEIAEKTGFRNRYHFTRVFKKYTFVTPCAYRNEK